MYLGHPEYEVSNFLRQKFVGLFLLTKYISNVDNERHVFRWCSLD